MDKSQLKINKLREANKNVIDEITIFQRIINKKINEKSEKLKKDLQIKINENK